MMDDHVAMIIAAIIATYGVLLIGGAWLVRPVRLRMAELAEDLLARGKLNRDEREMVNFILDTCLSFRIGIALPLAAIGMMIDVILRNEPPPTQLDDDPKFQAIIWRYWVSILSANPIAALVSLPLMALSFAVFLIYDGNEAPVRVLEEQLRKASGGLSYRPA